MVYIGPIRRAIPPLKSRSATGYEPDAGLTVGKESAKVFVPPKTERRKRTDRRKGRRNALLDSRSGQDRRKNHPHRINVNI